MASVHRHNKSCFWYCAYTLPNGRRVFRSTKQRDKKKAWDVCRTLERTSAHARAGELSQTRARKLFNDLLEIVGEEPLSKETIQSFFTSWLSGKEISVKPGVYKLYHKTVTKFLTSETKLLNLWVTSPPAILQRSATSASKRKA